jgi:hypothetical protein
MSRPPASFFLAWEKLRLLYNAILAFVVLGFGSHYFG